jgi:hypothetical protein
MAISIGIVASGSGLDFGTNGGTYILLYQVQGLDPTREDNEAIALTAVDASTGKRIPPYSQPHPTVAGYWVTGLRAYPMGTPESPNLSGKYVQVTYGTSNRGAPAVTIRITGSNGKKLIARWPDGPQKGKGIFVGYNPKGEKFPDQIPPADPKLAAQAAAAVVQQFYSHVGAEVLSPNTILEFGRRETKSPLLKSQQFRRRTNSTPWQGGTPGTWLCRKLDGIATTLTGFQPGFYDCAYAFEWDPMGWAEYGLFKNLDTGATPQDVDITDGTNNGYTKIEYPRADFNLLGLPSAF